MTSTVQESIEVHVPIRTAYNQWTQFESFPQFMDGVETISQLDDTHTHWKVKVGGQEREFDATITEQLPDERVAWKSAGGTTHAGVVTFHRLGDDDTRVTVQMDWQPEGFTEKAGAALGADDRRVKADLRRFKAFIERRQSETGSWRGEVPRPDAAGTSSGAPGYGEGAGQPGQGAGRPGYGSGAGEPGYGSPSGQGYGSPSAAPDPPTPGRPAGGW
ncbi:Polyketide cyclase / dehydrase family protein [Frankia canadensis]|uniref:Polyketide cyclase / dehydrase family protein n=1 Tax=Frankia canadensis TaxID=1836972 RepID=A0A2I2KYR3_9ACTN|nr:SRPBCC family protein [Frankia canadensis]SNQ50797.1 Polyketide cyclase / dehydrase family protein [Frankia canadensis]SOU58087.1 Polyketide cyclase / dehydrase family protein [Frankia canadensis]